MTYAPWRVGKSKRPNTSPPQGKPRVWGINGLSTRPIGALIRDLERQLVRTQKHVDHADWAQVAIDIHVKFDTVHGKRPDYRFWRLAMPPHYAAYRPELYPDGAHPPKAWGSWADAAIEASRSKNPVVLWSMLALCPEAIQRRAYAADLSTDAPMWRVVDRAREVLRGGLSPLRNSRASCGLTAALVLTRCQNIYQRAGQPLDLNGCRQYVSELRSWLRVTDASWKPGDEFRLDLLFAEQNGENRLLIGSENHVFTAFTTMLGIIRPTLSLTVHELTGGGDEQLKLAYQFAMTAWLTARAHRIRAMEQDQAWCSSTRSWIRYERSFLEEFGNCLNASNAARDAGEYLEAGKLLYLLFRLVPDEFRNLPEVQAELRNRSGVFRYLKEIGLDPDPRFAGWPSPASIAAYIDRQHVGRASEWRGDEAADNPGAPRERGSLAPATKPETGFVLRLRKEQETLTQWHTLLTDIPPKTSETPVGYLLTVSKGLSDHGFRATKRAQLAGFTVCLRYGYVRSAGKILARFVRSGEVELKPWMVTHFVRAVSKCTALDPFGIREKWFVEWRKLIREACDLLYRRFGENWMPPEDRHIVHETLNNRFHVYHAHMGVENARRLFEKSIGAYELSDLREFYDRYYDFRRRAPEVASLTQVATWLKQIGRPSLGTPVALSIVSMGSFVSVLAIGRDGTIAAEDCPADDLSDDIGSLLSGAGFWFKMQGPASNEIGWPASLRRLAETCSKSARRCDAKAKVMLMSMDSNLARLPWQNLMNRQRTTRAHWLVSIVPSLTAMTVSSRPMSHRGLIPLLSEERSPEIARVVRSVRQTASRINWGHASVCVAVGHGVRPDGSGLPGLRLGDGHIVQSFDEWLVRETARINIFHCCDSGVPSPLFMEEFGGLVGMAMYLGAKSFVAPVAEVLPDMAITLQKALFRHPRNTVGQAYLTAINASPGCCLYTLFGNPYESILPARPQSRNAVRLVASAVKAAKFRHGPNHSTYVRPQASRPEPRVDPVILNETADMVA